MFSGFETSVVDVGETTIFIRRKGSGRALLLLHGFPQTHLMWHRVAPALAEEFTVVCADLRGYGASGKPPSGPDHAPYSKSVMALDMIRVIEAQGFPRFSVAGHDRGARVTYRMALDHPERVERVALLDVIPTGEAFRRADARFALTFWPWSLLAQPEPLLALWSEGSGPDNWYGEAGGPLGIWSGWAADVTGRPIPGGHFFPEQNATETIAELRSFFGLR